MREYCETPITTWQQASIVLAINNNKRARGATRRLRTLSVHCSVQTDVSIMIPDSENLELLTKFHD